MAENTQDLKNALDDQDKITRREFAKQTVAGTVMLAGTSAGALQLVAQSPVGPGLNKQVVAALGSMFIPSRPGDPGYKDLESRGITDYVLGGRPVGGDPDRAEGSIEGDLLEAFNNAAKQFFNGKTFLELDEKQRDELSRKNFGRFLKRWGNRPDLLITSGARGMGSGFFRH